jgi:dihydrofolate reductase
VTVVASFSMSLDGFVADLEDRVGPLYDWLFNGTVEITPPGYPITYRMSRTSARYWTRVTEGVDAIVCGRRVFDLAAGWGGRPPGGGHAFVVTHRLPPPDWPPFPDAPFTFVDDVEAAVAQAKASGAGLVTVCGPDIARQCLRLGLLDEIRIDLVPVLLGRGVRCFDDIDTTVDLDHLDVIEGDEVTHLRYRVTHG